MWQLLVSVRKHFESFESFVIQSGDLIREGHHRMWTAKNRGRYDRSKLRYPSDLTDDEWAHVYFEHRMPVACDPERSAAAQHTFRLSRLVELRRHAGSHPSRALCGVSGARRTRSQPDRRHRR